MAQQDLSFVHHHKVLTIKCCIESPTIKRNPINIKNPSNDDWEKNLSNLLSKISKKFKFLCDLKDTEWCIKINGETIEKDNAQRLKHILQKIPPIPVVEIVKTQTKRDCYAIIVHFDDKTFQYPLKTDKDDWNDDLYEDLLKIITKQFDLRAEFALFECHGDTLIDIDDMDDVLDAFGDAQLLHLFVKTKRGQNMNRFKIKYGNESFEWIPMKTDTDDEKEWESNWDCLLNEILKHFHLKKEAIELQQYQFDAIFEVEADDLNEIWHDLVNNDNESITTLTVVRDPHSSQSQSPAELEPGEVVKSKETLEFKAWFDDKLQLPEYYPLFVEKGYINLNYLDVDLNEEELMNDIGIRSKQHRKKILNEIRRLVSQQSKQQDFKSDNSQISDSKTASRVSTEGDGEREPTEYQAWFEEVLRLPQYHPLFIASGFETFVDLECDLTDQDLIDIGIKKKPHRKRILNSIQNLLNNEQLFNEIKYCNCEKISKIIHQLGGLYVVNHFKSPLSQTKERIWMTVSRNNDNASAKEKEEFMRRFESEFIPNFDLEDDLCCNIIHILCAQIDSVDVESASLLLQYFMTESKCISKAAFVAKDKTQQTPLHYAVANDKIRCVQILSPLYTDNDLVQMNDINGKSIMDLAQKHPQMQQLLLNNDIGIDTINDNDEIQIWLTNTVKLPQYYSSFVDAGYEDMSYLDETIDDLDLLNDLGIMKKPHRKRILKEIALLVKQRMHSETTKTETAKTDTVCRKYIIWVVTFIPTSSTAPIPVYLF